MSEKRVIAPEIIYNWTVIDALREKVGTVDRVWTDAGGSTPLFFGIKTGYVVHETHVLPADGVELDYQHQSITVPYRSEQVKDGPTFSGDADLDGAVRDAVHRYYSGLTPDQIDPDRDMLEHLS